MIRNKFVDRHQWEKQSDDNDNDTEHDQSSKFEAKISPQHLNEQAAEKFFAATSPVL